MDKQQFSNMAMMTSSNGNMFRITGPLWGKPSMDSPYKGQWRGALKFSLIYAWTNGWANNRDDGDLDAIALIMTSP